MNVEARRLTIISHNFRISDSAVNTADSAAAFLNKIDPATNLSFPNVAD